MQLIDVVVLAKRIEATVLYILYIVYLVSKKQQFKYCVVKH